MNSQFSGHQSSYKQWVAALAAASIFLHPSIDIVWVFGPHDDISTNPILMKDLGLVIIGAIIGAVLADCFGRKRTLLATLIFVIPRFIVLIFGEEEWIWIVQSFVEIGSGIACTVVPLYISEVACTKNRGNLMVLPLLPYSFGLIIVICLLIINFNIGLSDRTITIIDGIILAITVLFHAITLALYPETPYYLNSKERYQEAGESLAYFGGINHLTIREDVIEVSAYRQTNNSKQGCFGKLSELMVFENRRSLAMIFSLIVIRWVSGQYGNDLRLQNWAELYEGNGYIYAISGIYCMKLIFAIVTVFAINCFQCKKPLLLVIVACLNAAIIGLPFLHLNSWGILTVSLVQYFGHIILVGITLAYTGEFFSINVRAVAVAVVISFEVLIRNTLLMTENLKPELAFHADSYPVQAYFGSGVFFIAFFFILIFFPKTNKMSSFEIAVENPSARALL